MSVFTTAGAQAGIYTTAGVPVFAPDVAGPIRSAAWRNVVHRTRAGVSSTGSSPGPRDITETYTLMRAVTAVRLHFNAVGGPGYPIETPVTITATFNGVAVRFNGSTSGVATQYAELVSDVITVPGNIGDLFTVAVHAEGDSVSRYPGPWKIAGVTDKPSVLVLGDSHTEENAFVDGLKDAGIPVTVAGVSGAHGGHFWDATFDAMGLITEGAGFTHAYVNVAHNALRTSTVDNTLFTTLGVGSRLRARGIPKVTQQTMWPHSDSADAWTTLAGQTLIMAADRAAINAWYRMGAPISPNGRGDLSGTSPNAIYVGQAGHPWTEIVDGDRWFQAGLEDDRWKVSSGVVTRDGTHLTPLGYSEMRPRMASWGGALA